MSSFKKTQKENRFLREGNSHGRSISFSRSATQMNVSLEGRIEERQRTDVQYSVG